MVTRVLEGGGKKQGHVCVFFCRETEIEKEKAVCAGRERSVGTRGTLARLLQSLRGGVDPPRSRASVESTAGGPLDRWTAGGTEDRRVGRRETAEAQGGPGCGERSSLLYSAGSDAPRRARIKRVQLWEAKRRVVATG